MKELTTGENRKQFEEWFIEFNKLHEYMNINYFDTLHFEMQLGVLISYYNSLGINISSIDNYTRLWCYQISKGDIHTGFKNPIQAYKEAFKKANKLINDKLK